MATMNCIKDAKFYIKIHEDHAQYSKARILVHKIVQNDSQQVCACKKVLYRKLTLRELFSALPLPPGKDSD